MALSESENQLLRNAKAAFERKNYSEAARIFQQILDSIDPIDAPVEAAEARNNLSVALLKDGQAQKAYEQAAGTDQVFSEYGEPLKQAMALGNTAAALAELGRPDEAIAVYKESAALFKQNDEGEMRSYVLQEIAGLQIKRGKQIESLFTMDAAIQSKSKLSAREVVLKKLMGIIHRILKTG